MHALSQDVESTRSNCLWYSRKNDLFTLEHESVSEPGIWLRAPYSICMEIGRHCNFRCKLCISDSSPAHHQENEWVIPALLNINRAFGPIRAVWSGGEPALYPNLLDYLLRSRALGNANVLVTNASRFIENAAVDWIDISLYGYSTETFRSFTGTSNFKSVERNLVRYCTEYGHVSASFVLGVHGFDALKKMVKIVIDAGVSRLKFHRLSLAGRNETEQGGDSADIEIGELQSYLSDFSVDASFTRTKSSEHKRKGYWVAKPPGVLTNSDIVVPLVETTQLVSAVSNYSSLNRSLFS